MTSLSDEELIREFYSCNNDRYGEYAGRVQHELDAYLRANGCGDENDRDDLISYALVKGFETKVDPEKFKSWLKTVAINRSRDLLRSRSRQVASEKGEEVLSATALERWKDEERNSQHEVPIEELIFGLRRKWLDTYRDSKPHLTILALLSKKSPIKLASRTHEELARIFNVTPQAVARWWKQVETLLRQLMQDYEGTIGDDR
jgi:RNA polymerase sigma factor (sigma-70 family)